MDLPSPPIDRRARYHTGRFLAAVVLLGLWALYAIHCQIGQIDELAQRNPAAAAEEVFCLARAVACGLGMGTVAIGAWVWWLGHRLRQTGYFPAPEIDVLHPTRIHTGTNTTDIGRAAQTVGLIVIFLGVASAWLLVQLAQTLLQN